MAVEAAQSIPIRKLRAHKKSRRGCGNCKLRKVKCDESKPKCNKCVSFGVLCNYDSQNSELQVSAGGAFNIVAGQLVLPSKQQTIKIIPAPAIRRRIGLIDINSVYHIGEFDLEILEKFQRRTIFSITSAKAMALYQGATTIDLAYKHPFLLHAILALTLMHDYYLASMDCDFSAAQLFHWQRAITLFNSKLSGPIETREKDALWATTVMLGTAAFGNIDVRTPEEAWPLKPPSSLDLNWLKMSDGKKEVFKLAEPDRADSIFHPLMEEFKSLSVTPSLELDEFPETFIKLFGLDAPLNTDNGPYRTSCMALSKVLGSNIKQNIILGFLKFISYMDAPYKQLLEGKDPRALLLLSYWYAKVNESGIWWMLKRARLECQAICMYLERYCWQDGDIQMLMEYPKRICFDDATIGSLIRDGSLDLPSCALKREELLRRRSSS